MHGGSSCHPERTRTSSPSKPSPLLSLPLIPRSPDPEANPQLSPFDSLARLGGLLLTFYLVNSVLSGGGQGGQGGQGGGRSAEISFQEFRNRLLAQGAVARLEVANGNLVKVGRRITYSCPFGSQSFIGERRTQLLTAVLLAPSVLHAGYRMSRLAPCWVGIPWCEASGSMVEAGKWTTSGVLRGTRCAGRGSLSCWRRTGQALCSRRVAKQPAAWRN